MPITTIDGEKYEHPYVRPAWKDQSPTKILAINTTTRTLACIDPHNGTLYPVGEGLKYNAPYDLWMAVPTDILSTSQYQELRHHIFHDVYNAMLHTPAE